MPTRLIRASIILERCIRTFAMPDPRRRLAEGQCAMPRPLAANIFRSAPFSMQQCANQQSSLSQPTRLQTAQRLGAALCTRNLATST